MSCSELVDNKKKSILVLGKSPTQELDDTKIKGEAKYPVNFQEENLSNSFLYVNAVKMHQF